VTFFAFVNENPGWTLVYLIVICGMLEEIFRHLARRGRS
jgi:hypothetical protein